MEQQVEALRGEALAEIAAAKDRATLEAARIRYLGKSGAVTAISEGMRNVPKEDRPRFGKLLNDLRQAVTQALDDSERLLLEAADSAAVSSLDLSLPGTWPSPGTLHPLTQLMDRAVRCFRRMGFAIADGPDIETEWHCFDALNTPADHPARNEQDTFYLPDGRLLRSHTSSVQIRVMENCPPPIRIIAPGAAYRRDEVDATHLAQFTQMEGLYVAEKVSLADLKGTLEFFFRELFGSGTNIQFRPHFFPFTEPSYEIDIRTEALGNEWMELAGCGMVDPAVFESICERRGDRVFDPEKVSGFAFGFGVERMLMIRHQIPDLRLFFSGDLRFLKQF